MPAPVPAGLARLVAGTDLGVDECSEQLVGCPALDLGGLHNLGRESPEDG